MKKISYFLISMLLLVGFSACNEEKSYEPDLQKSGTSSSNSLEGWYVMSGTHLATTEDFAQLNKAIKNHDVLYETRYAIYYAEYNNCFDDNGYFNFLPDFERKYFDMSIIENVYEFVYVIHIKGNKIMHQRLYLGNNTVKGKEVISKVYAGSELGTLYYYLYEELFNLSYNISGEYITTIDKQEIFTYEKNHIYHVSNGGTEYIRFTPNN